MKKLTWILMMAVAMFAIAPAATAEALCPELDCSKHSADTSGPEGVPNNRIELTELLRVIQFYNVGAYHCAVEGDGESEDGFTPGPGCVEEDTTPPVVTLNGNAEVTMEACSEHTDPDVTAVDAVDGNIAVEIYGVVNETMPGVYIVTYQAEDAAGNMAAVTQTVNVVDTTAPVVTLTGPATVEIQQGEGYDDQGASAHDGCRGFAHITWETVGFVFDNTPGVYTLEYIATDDFGNDASVSRTVTVVEDSNIDTTPPTIHIDGPLVLTIECGQEYTDDSYATDDSGEASLFVKTTLGGIIVPPVDGHTVGVFTIEYRAEDAAGNKAGPIIRTITVADSTVPMITLNGPASFELERGENYVEQGATALDTCEGSLTVTIGGDTVNTAVPGVYTITYNVVDSSGNTATQRTRTVTVVEAGELEITNQSTGISVPENTPVELTVGATGSNLTFRWEASGTVAAPGIVWEPVTTARWYGVSGMNTATLKFSLAQISSAMWYRCVVSDGTNTVTTKPIWLHVIDVFNGGGTTLNAIEIDMEAQGNNLSITVDPPTSNPGQYFFDDNVTRILFEFYFKDRDTVRASVAFDGTNPVNLIVPGILAGTEGILAFEMRGLVNEADDQGWISIGMQSFHILGIVRGDGRGNENPDDYHWIFPKGLGKSSMSSILDAFLGIE